MRNNPGRQHLPCLFRRCCPIVLVAACICNGFCAGEQRTKTTSTEFSVQAIESLKAADEGRQTAIDQIRDAPQNYAPPVFYVLSYMLFVDGKKDEAAFWFYAGQLRARFDANRCADVTARGAVNILNMQFGESINRYTFRDREKLKALVPKVIEWDRKTPHNYDHTWINSHGMDAVLESLGDSATGESVSSLPEEEWQRIAEETRAQYLDGFEKAMSPTGLGHPRDYFSDPDEIALALAVETGNLEEIELLASQGVNLNATGKDEQTPLHWAMLARNKASFESLLKHGANPNQQNSTTGESIISLAACEEEDSGWLRMVLAHGGDPNLANPTDDYLQGGKTPIFAAIHSRSKQNLDMLIDAGADINHASSFGTTPAMYAAGLNWFDSVYYLLKAGADYRIKHEKNGRDLVQQVLESRFPTSTWRKKVINFFEEEGVDLESAKQELTGAERD